MARTGTQVGLGPQAVTQQAVPRSYGFIVAVGQAPPYAIETFNGNGACRDVGWVRPQAVSQQAVPRTGGFIVAVGEAPPARNAGQNGQAAVDCPPPTAG